MEIVRNMALNENCSSEAHLDLTNLSRSVPLSSFGGFDLKLDPMALSLTSTILLLLLFFAVEDSKKSSEDLKTHAFRVSFTYISLL